MSAPAALAACAAFILLFHAQSCVVPSRLEPLTVCFFVGVFFCFFFGIWGCTAFGCHPCSLVTFRAIVLCWHFPRFGPTFGGGVVKHQRREQVAGMLVVDLVFVAVVKLRKKK